MHPKHGDRAAKGGGLVGPDGHPIEANAAHAAKGSDTELERLTREAAQAKDQYLRTLAEFENARKRLQREKEEFAKYAAEGLIRELLPVMDGMDQALVAVDQQADAQAVIKGIHLIYRQMLGLLEKQGVKRIPTIGERFDPHLHEGVGHVDTDDDTPADTIVEEVLVGYTMHGHVIRPAMVKVARSKETNNG